jgi:putative FmdB family regulatory protein
MPIYEYECSNCGCIKEVWQHFSDKPLTKCELCEGKMKKLISQSTFHLKGSGWYVTDYASKGSTAGTIKETSSKEKESPPKETKSSSGDTKKTTSSTKKETKAKD